MASVNALSVALFNAAAGGYSADMVKNPGAYVGAVGAVLEKDLSTDAAFVDHVLANFGIASTSALFAEAKAAMTGLVAGQGRALATTAAIDFLAGVPRTDKYAVVADAFFAKVTAATTFSTANARELDVSKLTAAVTGVDADVAAAAASFAAGAASRDSEVAALKVDVSTLQASLKTAQDAAAAAKTAADAAATKAAADLATANATIKLIDDTTFASESAAAAAAKTAAEAAAATAAAAAKTAADAAAVQLAAAQAEITALKNPAGKTLALTTTTVTPAGDLFIGTAGGNDSVTGTVAAAGSTYNSVDTIVDGSSTDNDTLTLSTSANITTTGIVSGFENVVINHTSFSDGSFALANFSAGNVTVNNLQSAGANAATVSSIASSSTVTGGTGVTGALTVSGRDGATALTVNAGDAGTVNLGKVADTTAAAITLNITSGATGTTGTPVNVNIEGSAATARDSATISAKGRVNLVTNSDGTGTDQVENLTLSGNGAAATYVIGNGAPTSMTISGTQNVTLEGIAAKFGGRTVTDSSTAVSKIKVVTTAAALDLTKVTVDDVEIAVDQTTSLVTVDSGENLTVSLAQTSLTVTSALATRATNAVNITVDDGATAVNSVTLGAAVFTNIATANITGVDNVAIANTATFGADGVVKYAGTGTLTVGATTGGITAKQVDASAASGVVTAFMTANMTNVVGGSGRDVILVEGDTNFTIDGGAGLDTVKFGVATLAADLNVADNTTTALSNVEVIEFVHDANARTLSIDSSLLTGKAIVVKGTHADDVLAVVMDSTTVDLSNINLGTNISKATISGAAIGTSALTITGTAMVDDVTGGSQGDTINLGEGNNIVTDAGDGDDVITTGAGNDTVTQAGAGNDTMNLGNGTNVVTDAGAGNDSITTGTGNDTVTDAGSGNDTMNLGNGTNVANGNSGDDVITGGTGADTFTGGADKDTLNGNAGADKLFGDNAGVKEVATLTIGGTPATTNTVAVTIFGTVLTVTLDGTTGASVATAAAAVKSAIDSTFGDYVTTGTIATGAFTVTAKLDGNLTDFAVTAGGGGATAAFGTKTDGGLSSGGVDTINAGAGADFVFGGEGRDVIDLGAADTDADTLVYVFNATAGADTVNNFEAGTGTDVIKFAKDLFTNGTLTATLKSITSTGTIADNDTFVEVTTAAAAGAVDTAAEVVTFLTNLGTTAVGNGDKVLLALNDGADMYLWAFTNDATAAIASGEVVLVARLVGVTDIADGDLAFFA